MDTRYWLITVLGAAAFVAIGVSWTTARNGRPWRRAFVQLVGGANIFAAALLAFLTCVSLVFMGLQRSFTPEPYDVLRIGTLSFVVAASFVWVKWGLVPNTTARGKGWSLVLGHLLIALGTVAYGSVTFFLPVLIWFGILEEASAMLMWYALFTLPLACVLWPIGLLLVIKSRSPGAADLLVAARGER